MRDNKGIVEYFKKNYEELEYKEYTFDKLGKEINKLKHWDIFQLKRIEGYYKGNSGLYTCS